MKKQHRKSAYSGKEAVALRYQQETSAAPVVIAKGKGLIAENIMERAKENNIPIQQDAALVELLGQLHLNEAIPEELYKAVAEVFAFVYRLEQNQSE